MGFLNESPVPGGHLRFSLRLNNDLTVSQFCELAVVAEESGFAQVWVSHDLFWRSAPVLVAAAGAVTSRVLLGIGIANPYSAHPSELAMHAATLAELTGGRFALGIGAGAEEFLRWAGLERTAPMATTRRAIVACRSLLAGRRPSEDLAPAPAAMAPAAMAPAAMAPAPAAMAPAAAAPAPAAVAAAVAGEWTNEAWLRWSAPPVPIYLGAMGPRMLALGGELADGVIALSFPPEHFTYACDAVVAGALAAGRNPAEVDVPACCWCSIDDDPERARLALAEKLAYFGASLAPSILARSGLAPSDFNAAQAAYHRDGALAGARLINYDMLSLGIAGDPATVAERCQGLIAAGATHLSFGPPIGPDPVQAVRRLGAEVLPLLRRKSASATGGTCR